MEGLPLEGTDIALTDENYTEDFSYEHCLRHITSIQVRNLSPFPARDTLATALSQRSTASSADSGLASDDTDMLLARKRSRRISSGSIGTLRSLHSDHSHETPNGVDLTPTPSRIRARASSKSSVHGSAITTPVSAKNVHSGSAGTTPAARRLRPRTTSQNSILDHTTFTSSSLTAESSTSTSGSSWLSDSLMPQKELEKVIWSRLVETFLTIETPSEKPQATQLPASPSTASPLGHKKAVPSTGSLSRRVALNNSNSKDLGRSNTSSPSPGVRQKRQSASVSSVASIPSSAARSRTSSPSHSTSNSTSITSPGSASPRKLTFPHSPPPTPPPSLGEPSSPLFISPVHRPSTNPKFVIDPQNNSYPPWADLTVDRAIVYLWGHVGTEWGATNYKGKGKEKDPPSNNLEANNGEWKILATWEFSFSELVPLPDDNVWKLPANTLVLAMGPENRAYFLPSSLVGVTPVPSRSHSPDYNSDSEIGVARPRKQASSAHDRVSTERGRQRRSKREVKSAGLNDLVKLVSLQSSLADAQNLLDQAVRNCDDLIADDKSTLLRREASQLEYRLQTLQEQHDILDDNMINVRDNIEARKEELKQRRLRLAEAKALHETDLLTEVDTGVKCSEEKKRVATLKSQVEPIRMSLLSNLAYMFPIELLSPPDLLFTILDVPLPIPLGETDPAPPLLLQSFPEVGEDSVATALGYAALVVHLMSTYLCRTLVYPITYVGSRSLIKDPISAMMGPRMFPLYSKGVDTYRFEYAVFLLNKDIELLMAERDLRAEDFRNTLPNLKNLLLTLTSGESFLPSSRPLPSPSISSGLRSPEPASSPSTTPKLTSKQLPGESVNGANEDGDRALNEPSNVAASSSAAGSSTPRRTRTYLFNVPLTSMFRVRYPSSSGKPSVKSVEETPETSEDTEGADVKTGSGIGSAVSVDVAEASDTQVDDDEEDRRTIRGSTTPVNEVGPNDKLGNGYCRLGSESEKNEKASGEGDIGQPNVRTAESALST